MERRKEPRLNLKQDVAITVLGGMVAPTMNACVLDISGNGMRLRVPTKLPAGTAIKIDAKNALVLAEVARCMPDGKAFTIGVTLLHSLSVFKDLEVLNRALFGENVVDSEVETPARS